MEQLSRSDRNVYEQRRDIRKQTPIAVEFEDCVQVFFQLCSAVEADTAAWKGVNAPLNDLFSKFRAWGNDTRASSRSLDYALRRASQLREQVIELLQAFKGELQDALQVVQSTAILLSPPIKLSENVEYFNILPVRGETVQTPGVVPDDSKSKIEKFTEDAWGTFDCLSDLVPLLLDPFPEDLYERDSSPSEAREDIELAESLFPSAGKLLVKRLGEANWKRRQYQRRLDKIRSENLQPVQNFNSPARIPSVLEGSPSRFPGAIASVMSSSARPRNELFPLDLNLPRQHRTVFANLSDGGMLSNSESVFSRAESKQSYFDRNSTTSVADSWETREPVKWSRFAMPKPPIPLQLGQGFLCRYCLHEILVGDDIKSMDDWADHVFMDLEPYMCTWDDCIRADKTFPSRDTWFRHELDNHRIPKVWFCQSCRLEFDLSGKFEEHLKNKHDNTLTPENLSVMSSMCERYSQKPLTDQACSLCGTLCSSAETLRDHIGVHMEQLALTSINSDDGLDEDNSNAIHQTPSIQGTSMQLKKERLDDFLLEQHQMIFANTSNPTEVVNNISTESDAGIVEDSDGDAPEKPTITAIEQVSGSSRVQRPGIKRNMESFVAKVEDFLDQQAQVDLETIASTLPTPADDSKLDPMSALGVHRMVKQSENFRTIRTMPPPRNDVFIGRESDLAKIYKELSIPGHTCILSGAAGLGKSATAIQYTYRFEHTYSYIFWIHAETPVGCADIYSLIASQVVLKQGEVVQEQDKLIMLSREFLEQCNKRWLLVFDNVNELSDVQQYLPSNLLETRGSILITTRKMEGWTLTVPSNYARIELGVLTLEDSRKLLLSSTNADYKDLQSHPEYHLAGQIANYAERLPLALSHIAGYILVSGCSLEDFVELWRERNKHTSFNPPAINSMSSTDKALEIVWNIGLREVTIDARELLNILAFLDSDTIQKDLLVGEHAEQSLEILHSSEKFRYKRMTNELSRRRLVAFRTRDGEEILSIHRSLQAKILQDLEKDPRQRDKVYQQAFCLVRKRFPLPSPIQVPEPAKWPACIKYLRHVLSLQKVFTGKLITIEPSVDLARLLSDGGIGLWERGMTNEGLELLRSAEAILNQIECNEDLLRANIHVIIALLIQDKGISYFSESKDRVWSALQIRKHFQVNTPPEKYTKDDDILLHNAWSDYGCVLLQYNKYIEAEPIFAHCLTKYKEWGPDESIPYEHAKYNHHMAFCQMYKKNFDEAVRLAEIGLHFIKLATGQGASTNTWKFDTACLILQTGDSETALNMHQEILASRLENHGKSSFLTLQSYYAIGALYDQFGDLALAESHMRDALTLEHSRRDQYPEAAVARTEFHLSQILRRRGKGLEEAEQLLSTARQVLDRLLPLNPLEGVPPEHEIALFDHIQPIFDGRFTGTLLLQYVAGQ